MFKKFHHLAEVAATNMSRRQFFGRLGRGAVTAAAVMGGMLVLADDAHALSCPVGYLPTLCPGGGGPRRGIRNVICCPSGSTCAKVKGKLVCQGSGSIG